MPNPPRKKGTSWETAVTVFMTACGLRAKRKALAGRFDKADLEVEGMPDLVIEAKNVARQALAEWLDELVAEMANAGARFGAVWHHRRGKASPGEGFVTMRGDHFADLLLELKELREQARLVRLDQDREDRNERAELRSALGEDY